MHFEFIDRTSTIRITFERRKRWNRISREWQIHFHQTFAFFQRNSRSVLRSFDQLPPLPPSCPTLFHLDSKKRKTNLKEGGRKENSEKKFHWGDCDAFLRFRPFRFDVFSTYFDASFFPQRFPDTDPFGPCLFSSQPFLTTVGPPDT